MLLEEIVQSVELWLKLIKKPQPYVDPNLDPVLLVPGIAGSILNAVDDENGTEERVWVRILGADYKFRTKLWSRFDPSTGKISDKVWKFRTKKLGACVWLPRNWSRNKGKKKKFMLLQKAWSCLSLILYVKHCLSEVELSLFNLVSEAELV